MSQQRERPDVRGKIRALIASTDTGVRRGIALWLARTQDIESVGEASDGRQILNLVQVSQPDVVVLDIDLPGTSNTRTTGGIFQHCPGTSIILLTAVARETLLPHMEAKGANGYAGNSDVLDDFLVAVRTLRAGEILVYLPP